MQKAPTYPVWGLFCGGTTNLPISRSGSPLAFGGSYTNTDAS